VFRSCQIAVVGSKTPMVVTPSPFQSPVIGTCPQGAVGKRSDVRSAGRVAVAQFPDEEVGGRIQLDHRQSW